MILLKPDSIITIYSATEKYRKLIIFSWFRSDKSLFLGYTFISLDNNLANLQYF